jgi:ketosteroid isomerase-like protein
MAIRASWAPLQAEYPVGAEFCDGPGDTVIALFRHRATDAATGESLDEPEVSVYEVRDGKVVRSQMFHADSARVGEFLARPATRLLR